jgi:hypothetical protein
MDLVGLTKKYFQCFCDQNVDGLSEMFADDIKLKDWANDVSGKEAVLEVIKGIYVAAVHVDITPDLITSEGNTVMAEILITAGSAALEVVDVIEFENDKIKAIRAYKI